MTNSFKEQAAQAAAQGRMLGTSAAYMLPFAVTMMVNSAFAQGTNPMGDLTETLNRDLQSSLEAGRDAGTDLACTGVMVFLSNDFVRFIFGLVLLVTLVGLGYAYYQNQRGGGGFSRLFFLIVGGMALVALVGTLAGTFMGCEAV